MSGHWSARYITFLRQVAPEIEVPIYLLRQSESATDWCAHWLASFSPLADLKAQSTLESLGLWRGRGVCVRVRDDFASWSDRCKFGTLLHECSHAIEHLNQADALCPMVDLSPVARELLTGSESQLLREAGICRNDLIKSQHGPVFARLCMHLHRRSRTEIPLAASDLQFLHPTYSLHQERYEDAVEALSAELAMSHNLNLLKLRPAPVAFLELFR